MKNKKKIGLIIFAIVCIVIIAVCVVIQIVIANSLKELEKESKKYETLLTQTLSGNQIETEYTHVDDHKFYIKIPISFKQLDYETIMKKYNGQVPSIVFSNDEITVNVAISMTDNDMSDSQINPYREYMLKLLENNSNIIESNCYKVDNHNVGQIKLISEAIDTNIYNNMIFFSYNGKLVIITFNCTENLREEWQNVGDFIIDSLFFKE